MSRIQYEEQNAFSSLLFDSLFGLVLFFNTDSFFSVTDPLHLAFYIFSLLIVIHWWFEFKAITDTYGDEIQRTTLHIIIGTALIVFLEHFVILTKDFQVETSILFLMGVFLLDIIWCLVFLYGGEWITKDKLKIFMMETELSFNLKVDIFGFLSFLLLWLLMPYLPLLAGIIIFMVTYMIYIYLTFHYKVIHIPLI